MELSFNLGPCTACCGGGGVCYQYYYYVRYKIFSPYQYWDRGGVLIADKGPQPPNVIARWYQPWGTPGALQRDPTKDWSAQVIKYNDGTIDFCPSVWNPCYNRTIETTFATTNVIINSAGLLARDVEMQRMYCPNFCYGCFAKGTN